MPAAQRPDVSAHAFPGLGVVLRELAARVAAVLLLALLGCSSSDSPPAPGGGDIVLITVDTLRPDHLSLFGYERQTSPHLEAWFGEQGILYERAYSTEANTPPSVVSILSGLLPEKHGVRRFYQLLDRSVPLVTDLLPARYTTAAFVSNIVLTKEALGIASRFDHYDDEVNEHTGWRNVWERRAEATTDAALRWVRDKADPDSPLFLWVHYIDPHAPYDAPADWPRRFRHEGSRPVVVKRIPLPMRVNLKKDALDYVDAYDEEIAYTDAEIGRLLAGLDELRGLDDALLVFTADHGESMLEHEQWFTHGYHVYEEIVRVPLAIRAPGAKPERRTQLVTGADVAPTILRFAGVALPEELEDVDLVSGRGLGPGRRIFVEASQPRLQWRAVVQDRSKWLAAIRPRTRVVRRRLFYDLAADPEELRPLAWRDGDEAPRELLARIQADPDPGGAPAQFAAGKRRDDLKRNPRLTAETRKRLRALGYVDPD